jgi:hypothetical protein
MVSLFINHQRHYCAVRGFYAKKAKVINEINGLQVVKLLIEVSLLPINGSSCGNN